MMNRFNLCFQVRLAALHNGGLDSDQEATPAAEVMRLAAIEARLNSFKWEHEWDDGGGFGDLRSANRAASRLTRLGRASQIETS